MATAYTPILKLALPVTGELNGTWGDVVNQNITEMVEQAVAGLATINTWTTNSHTLTTANGTTSESRCAMLVIDDDGAGNPSAAATVICPTATKAYIVRNLCGQTVTVKTAAGTGVAVPNNQAALVFCDGTNVVTGSFNGDVVGPATATNNAIVTFDGTTGKIIKDNSGATISAGVITATGFSGPLNGSVGATTPSTVVATQVDITAQGDLRLQDTTGGQYVALQAPGTIATSYTLTLPVDDGTAGQALITDGSGVLSWSTAASGDVYGPASATDNAVARYDGTTGKIIQNSSVIIDDSNNVSGVVQLTTSGAVTLNGGTANGVAYLNGSNVLTTGSALTYNGSTLGVSTSTATVRVKSTAAGSNASVVVDTTTTDVASLLQLDINGSTRAYVGAGGATYPNLGGNNSLFLWNVANGPTVFANNDAEQMRLTSTGLGIGTSSLSGKLDVRQTVNNTDMFYGRRQTDTGGGAGNFINFDSSGGGTSVFKVSTRADIEAGTLLLAPVKKGIGSLTFVLDAGDATTTQNTQAYRFRQYITTGGSIPSFSIEPTRDGDFNYTALLVNATENTVGTATGKYLLNLQRNGTSRFVVQSSGNVGIGTTTPAQKLDVAGTINARATDATGFNQSFDTSEITTGRSQFRLRNTSGGVIIGIEGATAGLSVSGSAAYSSFIGNFAANPLYLVTNSAIRATLDSSGNLGLGVTPSAWASSVRALEMKTGAFYSFSSGSVSNFYMMSNSFLNSSGNPQYKDSAAAAQYLQFAGAHAWFNAPSGTAGNAISFTQAMTLDASGNLGVGTTTPAGKLDVNGAVFLRYSTVINNGQSIPLTVYGSAGSFMSIPWGRNASEAQLFTSNSPNQYFTGSAAGDSGIQSLGTAKLYMGTVGNAAAVFSTNNTERMRLDSAGNLGLGVTPSAWATVLGSQVQSASISGTSTQAFFSNGAYFNAGWKYIGTGVSAQQYAQDGGSHYWNVAPSGTAGNAISFTQAMTLNSSGNLIVGTTVPAGSSQITAYGGSNGQIAVQNSTNWSRLLQNSNDLYIDNGVGGSAGNIIFRSSSSTVERMRLDASGNLVIGSTNTGYAKLAVFDATNALFAVANSTSFSQLQQNGANLYINTNVSGAAGGDTIFRNGATTVERMRLDSAGNLGIGTSSPAYTVDLGQQLLATSATDSKVVYRLANQIGVKRKFGTTVADTILFDIQCGAASANTQGGFEITVFAAGGKTGVSADRQYTAKWYVVRNDAGTFTITRLYEAGSAGAINVVANGNSLNINAIFSVIDQGGCFAEIKGMLGPPNAGSVETAYTVVLP